MELLGCRTLLEKYVTGGWGFESLSLFPLPACSACFLLMLLCLPWHYGHTTLWNCRLKQALLSLCILSQQQKKNRFTLKGEASCSQTEIGVSRNEGLGNTNKRQDITSNLSRGAQNRPRFLFTVIISTVRHRDRPCSRQNYHGYTHLRLLSWSSTLIMSHNLSSKSSRTSPLQP